MQSELRSLSKIFSEAIYRIPDYQRGYAWQERQLKDFWVDIEQLEHGKNHYTGVLTLEPVSSSEYGRWDDDTWIIDSKKYSPLYVVDGQQRLTTAIILLQTILERLDETQTLNFTSKADIRKKFIFESKDGGISRSYVFGYEKDNPSHEFLKRSIFCELSDTHSTTEETIYTANLAAAKKYFSETLEPLDTSSIERVYTKLTQHLLFNIFTIEPGLDVFVTFETMNNRGKPLSHLELLKNRLIYLSTRFNAEPTEKERLRKAINESWKTVYHFLGKSKGRPLRDDLFLRAHFFSYFGPNLKKPVSADDEAVEYDFIRFRRDDFFKTHLLEEIFTPKRLFSTTEKKALTIDEIYEFSQDIKQSVDLYYAIFNPAESKFSGDERLQLERLNRLGTFPARLLCLVTMREVLIETKRVALLTTLERFTFLAQFRPTVMIEVNIERLAVELKAGEKTIDEVTQLLQKSSESFAASPEFYEALQFIGRERSYYAWSPLRYFLFEYEQHLRVKGKAERETLSWEAFSEEDYEKDHSTIEHIYPQKPKDEFWRKRFEQYSLKERNVLKNSLGNLLPLSRPKNASVGNKPFPDKKGSATNQAGYQYGCHAEIQVAQESDWTPLHILKRGLRLLDFMEQRWQLRIGDKAKKASALGLSFVANREGVDVNAL